MISLFDLVRCYLFISSNPNTMEGADEDEDEDCNMGLDESWIDVSTEGHDLLPTSNPDQCNCMCSSSNVSLHRGLGSRFVM